MTHPYLAYILNVFCENMDDYFQFWPFCHFIDLQLLITTEMLSLSIKFHVSLLSHVIGVKHDCNVVIRPYFQSTPNYVQCVWAEMPGPTAGASDPKIKLSVLKFT